MPKKFWDTEGELKKVAYAPVYTELTGDLAAGIVLSQLVYWFKPSRAGKSKLTVVRDGTLWLAKNRQEMRAECGLTEWQYRSAMDKLKDMGLVEVQTHLFHGKTTPHIRLELDRLAALLAGVLSAAEHNVRLEESSRPELSTPHDRFGEILTTGLEVSSQPKYTEITAGTTTESTPAVAALPLQVEERRVSKAVGGGSQIGDNVREDPEVEILGNVVRVQFSRPEPVRSRTMKAEDILKAHQEKRLAPPSGKVGTNALVILWKRRMATVYGGFQKEFTGKELGQMKQFAAATGDRAPQALDWAIQNWSKFAFEAKEKKGLKSAPVEPVVGFLLAHHDVALQLIAKPTKPNVQSQEPNPPTVPPAAQVAPESKPTQDDVMAALKQFATEGEE